MGRPILATRVLIAVSLIALSACETSATRQQKQEAIAAIKSYRAQAPASIDVMMSEFEERCSAVVGKSFPSTESAAQAAGLKTPGIDIPKTRRAGAYTLFLSPGVPSIAFLMPRSPKRSCIMVANSADVVSDLDRIGAAYLARNDAQALTVEGNQGTVAVTLDSGQEQKMIIVEAAKPKQKAVRLNMLPKPATKP